MRTPKDPIILAEYLDLKRTLKNNLIVGAVIGIVLAGLMAWLFVAPNEVVDESYTEYMLQQGYTEAEASLAATVFLALFGPATFLYGLFLPLGCTALNRMKNRLLEGWLVSCLLMIFIQFLFFVIVVIFGSIVGFLYLVYGIVRMAILKKRVRKNGGNC